MHAHLRRASSRTSAHFSRWRDLAWSA